MPKIAIIFLLVSGCIVAGTWYVAAYGEDDNRVIPVTTSEISTYSECVAAGNPVMESYPEQCRSEDGRTFVNSVSAAQEDNFPTFVTDADSDKAAAVRSVQSQATVDLKVTSDQIEIVSVTAEEWPDGCLGLGGPEEMCTMMITAGYEIILTADSQLAVYRTDQSGSIVKNEQTL